MDGTREVGKQRILDKDEQGLRFWGVEKRISTG